MPTPAFVAHINDVCAQAAAQGRAAGMPGVARRPWQVPSAYPVGTDVQDPAGFVTACDRSALNALCVAEYLAGYEPDRGGNPAAGRLGVVGAYKTAIDYQAAFERALHARHAPPVRLRAWAAARRAGHGDTTYGVFGCVARAVDDGIGAARSVPNSQ